MARVFGTSELRWDTPGRGVPTGENFAYAKAFATARLSQAVADRELLGARIVGSLARGVANTTPRSDIDILILIGSDRDDDVIASGIRGEMYDEIGVRAGISLQMIPYRLGSESPVYPHSSRLFRAEPSEGNIFGLDPLDAVPERKESDRKILEDFARFQYEYFSGRRPGSSNDYDHNVLSLAFSGPKNVSTRLAGLSRNPVLAAKEDRILQFRSRIADVPAIAEPYDLLIEGDSEYEQVLTKVVRGECSRQAYRSWLRSAADMYRPEAEGLFLGIMNNVDLLMDTETCAEINETPFSYQARK